MRFGPSLFWFFHKAFRFKSYEYLLNDKYQYGNTSITRPYIDYKEKTIQGYFREIQTDI